MGVDPDFAHAVMYAINGFNELERHAMRVAILAEPRIHCILALYDMMYTDRVGELWFFDEDGNLTHTQQPRRGVRQGCVIGLFIFCVTMAPIYMDIKNHLGREGLQIDFSDDVYLHGPPVRVAAAITAAPALYKKVRLRVSWGPAKSELALPPGVDAETLTLPRREDGRILPHLVEGLEACIGIPRHRRLCSDFISKAMENHAARHDRFLQLVRDIAEDEPLTTLRILQVCGVNRFGR